MSIYRALKDEWDTMSTTPAARGALAGWARAEPVLAGFTDPRELVGAIQGGADTANSCARLAALVRLAAQPLAARAVLQVILPGLGGVVTGEWRSAGWRDGPSAWDRLDDVHVEVVAAAWEVIAASAGRSLAFPARNLIRGVRRRLRTTREAHERTARRTVSLDPVVHDRHAAPHSARSSAEHAADVVVDAVRAGRLSAAQGRLLYATGVIGIAAAEVGQREGLPPKAVYYALAKAEAALARSCA
jgi:hypothetical protein